MNKKGQKGFVLGVLISLTIIILIILPVLWLGYWQITNKSTGELVEASLGVKILFTVVGAFLLIFGWWNYLRQKNIDSGKPQKQGSKAMSNVYKASGYYGRVKAVGSIITGVVLIIIGIILIIIASKYGEITIGAFILPLFGVLAVIYGWVLWIRTKSLVKGRFY